MKTCSDAEYKIREETLENILNMYVEHLNTISGEELNATGIASLCENSNMKIIKI